MVSMSMTSMLPKPVRARSLSSSQPRPPAPTHRMRQLVCAMGPKTHTFRVRSWPDVNQWFGFRVFQCAANTHCEPKAIEIDMKRLNDAEEWLICDSADGAGLALDKYAQLMQQQRHK